MMALVGVRGGAWDPEALHALARESYAFRDRSDPVGSSEQGLHTWDGELSDPSQFAERRKRVEALLARAKALDTSGWSKDDRVDAILLRAQLEREAFFGGALQFARTQPQ